MEYSNLENDSDYKEELILAFVNDVSPLVLLNIITDDTPSPRNAPSGLDQVIMFEVGEYMDDIFDLDFVKAGIRLQIGLLKRDLRNGLISEDDIFNADFYSEIYEEKNEYSDSDDPYEGEPYINDGYFHHKDDRDDYDDEYWAEYYNYEFDDKRFQEKIKRFAVGYLIGGITADNPSKINGLTGYEQVIYYLAHLLPAENEKERRKNVKRINQKVQSHLSDFNGGVNLISLLNSY